MLILTIQANLGLAANTIEAYGRALEGYLGFSAHRGVDPDSATREHVAAYVRDLPTRPNPRGPNVRVLDSGVGLANATLQQRLTAIRLYYDYLIGQWAHTDRLRPALVGKPLSAKAKAHHLAAASAFFRDCQEWSWIPRRIDPRRCFAAPRSIRDLMVPNPRVIADDVWAKLLWAGLDLSEADLSTSFQPAQPALVDPKTAEPTHYMFAYRGRPISPGYLNDTLIRMLCHKAGVPESDARGGITSHRARSTIASQLFNAKEPMSLMDLQAWLGHRTPASTQHYAKITPTKLAKSYTDAGYFGRNLRMIEVLIDRDAVKSGAATTGEPWRFYDLGHGCCSYDFFDRCLHRMACARCAFYLLKGSSKAQMLEGKASLQRMLQEIPLTTTSGRRWRTGWLRTRGSWRSWPTCRRRPDRRRANW